MVDFPAATPHGPLIEVDDDLWCVRGTFDMGPGMRISRTMTIVRTGDALTLINGLRLVDEALLTGLGQVRHVVKLADGHGYDDPYLVARFGAAFWSLEGATHPRLPRDRTLGPESPLPDGVVVRAGVARPEAAIRLHRGDGTLITCDAIQNHADTEGASRLATWITPWLGFHGGVIVAPMWRRNHGLNGAAVGAALRDYVAAPFANLITGHGPPVRGHAHAAVEAAIAAASR